ncbi:MAG TPA: glycosyltransferase, partial [Candidatus Paceibacterota bacterium]|nr:glycosyltransferase [Candidatus Paceibacterota bacterium]
KGFKYKFLRNIPREDVLAAFCQSRLFLSASGKEVFPITILECMASRLPWVSMDVGIVEQMKGGWVIKNTKVDDKGYKVFTKDILDKYVNKVSSLLGGDRLQEDISDILDEGEREIEEIYNWKNICEKYYNIFIS